MMLQLRGSMSPPMNQMRVPILASLLVMHFVAGSLLGAAAAQARSASEAERTPVQWTDSQVDSLLFSVQEGDSDAVQILLSHAKHWRAEDQKDLFHFLVRAGVSGVPLEILKHITLAEDIEDKALLASQFRRYRAKNLFGPIGKETPDNSMTEAEVNTLLGMVQGPPDVRWLMNMFDGTYRLDIPKGVLVTLNGWRAAEQEEDISNTLASILSRYPDVPPDAADTVLLPARKPDPGPRGRRTRGEQSRPMPQFTEEQRNQAAVQAVQMVKESSKCCYQNDLLERLLPHMVALGLRLHEKPTSSGSQEFNGLAEALLARLCQCAEQRTSTDWPIIYIPPEFLTEGADGHECDYMESLDLLRANDLIRRGEQDIVRVDRLSAVIPLGPLFFVIFEPWDIQHPRDMSGPRTFAKFGFFAIMDDGRWYIAAYQPASTGFAN